MTEPLDLDLLSIHNTRRQVDVFLDNPSLHAEALAVAAGLPDDAAGSIALLAPLPDAVVADDCAPAAALEALPRLTALLGASALARVTYRALVHLHECLHALESVNEDKALEYVEFI